MRITYYALKPVRVGDEERQPGDLVPEAVAWPFVAGYVQDGRLAPVLVATLPEEQQMMLLEWEEAQQSGNTASEPSVKDKKKEKANA